MRCAVARIVQHGGEGLEMRLEPGAYLQRRRFHLDKAFRGEKLPHRGEDAAARGEVVAARREPVGPPPSVTAPWPAIALPPSPPNW